jgi:HNH endonuclease/NUMOD4 motif
VTERWLPVVGFDGYEISDQGRVRNCAGRILALKRGKYVRIGLYRDGVQVYRLVHRLLLEAFVGLCPPGLEACHANDIGTDNRLTNLRWDTRSANMLDRVRNGNHNNARKTRCPSGHAYIESNIYWDNGCRKCRQCTLDRQRSYRALVRAS